MARIFVTGSTDGLGRAAARTLIDEGHQVVLHARSRDRASALDDLASRSAGLIIGDLGSAVETRSVAAQVNTIGRMDAVIYNAGNPPEKPDCAVPVLYLILRFLVDLAVLAVRIRPKSLRVAGSSGTNPTLSAILLRARMISARASAGWRR